MRLHGGVRVGGKTYRAPNIDPVAVVGLRGNQTLVPSHKIYFPYDVIISVGIKI